MAREMIAYSLLAIRHSRRAHMTQRVVLLTGAAGGIGRVMTQALLADGHKVAAVDRDPLSLERLKALCQSNDRLHCVVAQLELEAGCRRAVEETQKRFGRVEAVI